ncbi:hypothetical protein BOTBODRAFT_37231 [Botryobasidium botryosum FD-172 SS1]|uniref:Uncharacterized protein n=1 Tax=Botryobasidium botryosum (strain FD-172 SS1) TaxID=930990 RepID=A0A067M1C3_BOTB1|nr:hypothetical protein BOTBODRAFT_37231 [Botryobasidium botryosum FD-172 SS1]
MRVVTRFTAAVSCALLVTGAPLLPIVDSLPIGALGGALPGSSSSGSPLGGLPVVSDLLPTGTEANPLGAVTSGLSSVAGPASGLSGGEGGLPLVGGLLRRDLPGADLLSALPVGSLLPGGASSQSSGPLGALPIPMDVLKDLPLVGQALPVRRDLPGADLLGGLPLGTLLPGGSESSGSPLNALPTGMLKGLPVVGGLLPRQLSGLDALPLNALLPGAASSGSSDMLSALPTGMLKDLPVLGGVLPRALPGGDLLGGLPLDGLVPSGGSGSSSPLGGLPTGILGGLPIVGGMLPRQLPVGGDILNALPIHNLLPELSGIIPSTGGLLPVRAVPDIRA